MPLDLNDQRRSTNVEDLRDWGPYLTNLIFGKTMNRLDPEYTAGPNEALMHLYHQGTDRTPLARDLGSEDLERMFPLVPRGG